MVWASPSTNTRLNNMMSDLFVIIIFGWPAVITSILLSIVGLLLMKPKFLIVAGIVCVPFTYYASNGFRTPVLLLPLFQLISAYAIERQNNFMAWLLVMPLIIFSVALAISVLTQ